MGLVPLGFVDFVGVGFAGAVAFPGCVVVVGGALVEADDVPVGLFAPEGAETLPAAGFDPDEFMLPEAGLVVGVAAGRVVIGVGSGGKGFDMTLAIISVRPASD